MGSSGQFSTSLTPFLAIMQADLVGLFKSKLTYGWLIAALFLEVIRVLSSHVGGTMSNVIGSAFSDFILIWSVIIIGLTASAVSSEVGEFADSIMSKSVTRFDYLFAKFSARIVYVLTVFGVISLITIGLSLRLLDNDYQTYGLVYSAFLVALVLITLTTLGVALSTVSPNTIIAIIALLVIWYFMSIFFQPAGVGFLSPSNIASGLPHDIRGVWPSDEWETVIGYVGIALSSFGLSTIYFYIKDV